MWTASATPITTSERSVDKGRHESDALRRAPDASWISLMRAPPLPMMEPIKMWGISRRRGYVLECWLEGSPRGSLLSVRMIKPKACGWVSIFSLVGGFRDVLSQQHRQCRSP
jgi:hypothetical protein